MHWAVLCRSGEMHRRQFVISAFALTGCASVGADRRPSDFAELEPLYRAEAGPDGMTISISSNGCTTKADVSFYVERWRRGVTQAFGRKPIDTCKSISAGRTDLNYSWAELGLNPTTPVRVLNPLIDRIAPAA